MKKAFIYTFAAIGLMMSTISCDDFGDVNSDKEHLNPGNMDYRFMFTQVQSQIAGSDWDAWRNGLIYSASMIQHVASPNWSQGNFYTWSEGYNAAYWDSYYSGNRAAIRNITEVIKVWDNNPEFINEYQFARVMKVYMFQRMTDLYGDVPYSQASQPDLYSYPKYDTQEAIYDHMLKELDEVNTALTSPSAKNSISNADVLFKGNATSWKKFANSLMLRLATRLTKIDPAKAETWTKKAIANGLIEKHSESAVLNHANAIVTNDSAQPFGKILSNEDPQAFHLSEYFIDNLKTNDDPRIHLIATKLTSPNEKWSGDKFDFGSSADASKLIGFPVGYLSGEGDWGIQKVNKVRPFFPDYEDTKGGTDKEAIKRNEEAWKDWRSICAFPNRYTFGRPDAPSMLVTYAEDQLLLADAAMNALIPGGKAEAKKYFEKGIRAAFEQLTFYVAGKPLYDAYLAGAKTDDYVTKALVRFDANPLEAINWEYYVLTFGDEYEAFANWRRTGYPTIKSVYEAPHNRPKYTNSISDEIPRRFTYPTSESQRNNTNYMEASKRLSDGDKMTSRVWWDKK